MRYQGRITIWNDDKGFGFVTPNGSSDKVFIHISAFSNRQHRPEGNELVTYELAVDGKGRTQAKSAAFVGDRLAQTKPVGRSSIPPLFAACFLLFVIATVIGGRIPAVVLGGYLVASLVTFLAYAFDKSAAQRNQWRTQENTLHLFALIGGWPGALAAQRLLRHKSAKMSFLAAFWATVILNCGALAWLLTSTGSQWIQSVLHH
jgi:uncharacterized membrane protein YsdA (DUF1294 family)/cold shock CspA family protein